MLKLTKKSWKDINLKEYKKICEIDKRELDSPLEKDIAVLAVLLNVPESQLYDININELKSLLNEVSWINTEKYTYTNKIKKLKTLKIDGKEYIVNPDINNYTVAQYMDFQNFWDKRDKYMGNLLAVFIIPKGHKYNDGYDVMELADRLEEVFTLDDWNDVCFFFLKTYYNSIRDSLTSSDLILKKMMKTCKNDKNMMETLMKTREQLQQQINNFH